MAVTTAPAPRVRLSSRTAELTRNAVVRHRERVGNAAASRDVFMDVIVLLSVLTFIALVVGVAVLAIQTAAPQLLHL